MVGRDVHLGMAEAGNRSIYLCGGMSRKTLGHREYGWSKCENRRQKGGEGKKTEERFRSH